MILNSLNEYYHRLAADSAFDIPRLGFSRQMISFAMESTGMEGTVASS
jgi:hypothetical protein